MRYRNTAKWTDSAKDSPALFFAQLLDEMLFDFSLPTYKPAVMNAGLLAAETVRTIASVEDGSLKAPNIKHVVEEFLHVAERDEVAISRLPIPLEALQRKVHDKGVSNGSLKSVFEMLARHLSPKAYLDHLRTAILDCLAQNDLQRLQQLARSFVTTLINIGYDSRYVHDEMLDFFHYGPGQIESNAEVSDFLSRFTLESKNYTVVFRADPIFEHVTEAFEGMKLKITQDPPADLDLSGFPSFSTKSSRLFAIVEDVRAMDPVSARGQAERTLGLSGTLLVLFHHKESPEWSEDSIVSDKSTGTLMRIKAGTNAMHKCVDSAKPIASQRLLAFANDFSLEEHSFNKFIRSAQLHALAVGSRSIENQLLNLWIALESLIPAESRSENSSNIEHIIDQLVPFHNLVYMERLINNLVKDLLRWSSVKIRKIFKKIPEKKFADKLVRILVLPKFAAEQADLLSICEGYPLLRHRVSQFIATLSTPKSVADALNAHEQRLRWQIRRIYRTRNLIVHDGKTPQQTKILIEHTHNYLDTVLDVLVRLASRPKTIHSVGQGFEFVGLKYAEHKRLLESKTAKFDETNLERLVLFR